MRTISTLSDLQALRRFSGRYGIRDVSVELAGSSDDIRRLEAAINKSLKACGCDIGAALVAIGLVAAVVTSQLAPDALDWGSGRTLAGVIGLLVSLALTGKVIGLAIAHRRVQLAIDSFERATATRSGSESPFGPEHVPVDG